jgi:two-component sensor histidine kinase
MEVMLKEIHHRVKNNLQIISSLLRLQAEKDVKDSNEMFREAIDRVNAIAMIHERIYKTDALSEFDMKIYLETLIKHLLDSYTLQHSVTIRHDVRVKEICTECLVPISLLFNELISNSLKHAFAHQHTPEIEINLNSDAADNLIISYSDNGQWIESNKATFGMELIEAMTLQMEGTYTRQSTGNFTRYEFILKRNSGSV